ncbi:hypothetical protein DES49_0531 [Halospina denitrificans]|uniref:Uncharacterized protein n=1 Tax=Halospina denitrificans TaxID=332522 RepID=A0A4R7K467_9GAMM|nr:hypothetical protein DES49_0531 [Halospina denitrificans]
MNHTFRTINRYHDQFESYKRVVTLESLTFWLSMLSVVAFVYSLFWLFNNQLWPKSTIDHNVRIFFVMGLEILVLFFWFKLQSKRDKLVVESAKELLSTDEEDISSLKKLWLEETLGVTSREFFDLAIEIDQMLDLKERNRSPLSLDGKKLAGYIFAPESRNRILAMFMGVCAAIIGLSISAGASLEDVFSFVEGESIGSMAIIVAVISLFLMLGYLVLWYMFLMIAASISMGFEWFDGLNSTSHRRARTFINQLIILHELPKGRVRSNT